MFLHRSYHQAQNVVPSNTDSVAELAQSGIRTIFVMKLHLNSVGHDYNTRSGVRVAGATPSHDVWVCLDLLHVICDM